MNDHPCHKEEAINKICVSVTAIEVALLGDIETRTPGLLEEHREMMRYIGRRRWFAREIISAFVGAVVAGICVVIGIEGKK